MIPTIVAAAVITLFVRPRTDLVGPCIYQHVRLVRPDQRPDRRPDPPGVASRASVAPNIAKRTAVEARFFVEAENPLSNDVLLNLICASSDGYRWY